MIMNVLWPIQWWMKNCPLTVWQQQKQLTSTDVVSLSETFALG